MPLSQFKTPFHKAKIILKEKIAAHTYHLKLQGDEIRTLDYTPGMHMKVLVGLNEDVTQNSHVRSYSIWDLNAEAGTLDLAVCTHSGGLGTQWIEAVEANTDFYFFLKKTLIADDSGQNYFFIGDVSTLAHFYKVNRSLSKGRTVQGFIYSDNPEDFFPDLDGGKPFDFYTLKAEGKLSDNNSVVPINFFTALFSDNKKLNTENAIVYLGGDARVCAAMTILFSQKLNFAPEQIKMKSFWNPDKVREDS